MFQLRVIRITSFH